MNKLTLGFITVLAISVSLVSNCSQVDIKTTSNQFKISEKPMSEFLDVNAMLSGFSYSKELANMFGLPSAEAMDLDSPLLASALDIKTGNRGGSICRIHVLIRSDTDMRLPEDQQLNSVSGQFDQIPYSFIKKPQADIRKKIGEQVRALANRAIMRFGTAALDDGIVANEDPNASYVSLPLDSYHKDFVPGVTWIVMPINCALAADEKHTSFSLFLESSKSPSDMILNQFIDPNKMLELKIPTVMFRSMQEELNFALESDENASSIGKAPDTYKIISR
jgi:hypothetical protein